MTAATRQLVRRLDELGRISDESGKLTRTFLSPAMRRANACVAGWMRAEGLAVREDAVGNVIGRLDAGAPAQRGTLVLGSHLDTVRDAGRFDGALGVVLAIAAVQELRRRRPGPLPFAVEVVGFSEEEGVRFASAYLGSKGYAGTLRAADLAVRDAAGVSVRGALAEFGGGKFVAPRAPTKGSLLGYVEVHIEQGPVLEAENLAVGVVAGIAGQTRVRLTWTGRAGHAGTTPMALRRDALAGAAEFVGEVERLARARAPLVATVGTIEARPGAPNVIPGRTVMALDVRHPRDGARRKALQALRRKAAAIATARGLTLAWEVTQDNAAVDCDGALRRRLQRAVEDVQGRSRTLVSGAGHDAVAMAAVAPVAMLFVRCRAGLSHHPAEHAAPRDIGVALAVMVEFLARLADES